MEAERNVRGSGWQSYKVRPWGELIYGSEEQLRQLGLGLGQQFPKQGTCGLSKAEVLTTDPRGLKARIRHHSGPLFSVAIPLPGRQCFYETQKAAWTNYAPGVQRGLHSAWGDEFVGKAEDLVRAGVVPAGHFPGMPGMRKTRVTILPDGTLPSGPLNASHPLRRAEGAKSVQRSGTKYLVMTYVSKQEAKLRQLMLSRLEALHDARMMELPAPPPLRPLTAAELVMLSDTDLQDLSEAEQVLARFRQSTARGFLR